MGQKSKKTKSSLASFWRMWVRQKSIHSARETLPSLFVSTALNITARPCHQPPPPPSPGDPPFPSPNPPSVAPWGCGRRTSRARSRGPAPAPSPTAALMPPFLLRTEPVGTGVGPNLDHGVELGGVDLPVQVRVRVREGLDEGEVEPAPVRALPVAQCLGQVNLGSASEGRDWRELRGASG